MVDLISLILGITLALIATLFMNIGIILQKKGLKEGPKLNLDDGMLKLFKNFLRYFKNKSWATGFILGNIGWIPYLIAQGFVGIIVVQPLQSAGLILMALIASRYLDEKISISEIIAVCMLIFAPIVIVFSGVSSIQIDLKFIIQPLLAFLAIVFAIIFIFIAISRKQKDNQWKGMLKVMTAGLFFSLGGMFANIFTQAWNDASINLISPFGWAEVMFGIAWFEFYHAWIFFSLYGFLIFDSMGIIYQNIGLQKGRAVVLWPIQSSINLIVPVMGGLLIFRQSVNNVMLFSIAIVMILVATIILSKFQADLEQLERRVF